MTPTEPEIHAELARRLELARQARGWAGFLRLVVRLQRQDAGDPPVHLHGDRAA